MFAPVRIILKICKYHVKKYLCKEEYISQIYQKLPISILKYLYFIDFILIFLNDLYMYAINSCGSMTI